jgi:glycosyltransferase involved in cell wall biosynthesis
MTPKLRDEMESSAQNPRNDDGYKRRYFNDASQTADDTTSAISSKRTRPVIVFVGRIDPLKDIVKLLVAISYVRREIPEVLCKIYGTASSIEYANKCVNIVESYGLQNNVLFMGGTKSPETAYFEADVVAICSVSEGFPFSVIEAMASAKLVVATNVGGVAEALDGYGFLVPPADPRVFANALVSALMNEKLRKELGRRSQAVARTKFDLQTMVERYQQQYDLLMKKSLLICNDGNNNNNHHLDRSDAE